jgi:hypothetical protein
MLFHWRQYVSILSLAGAASALVACSGTIDGPEVNPSQNDEAEYVADENGVVLGTSWQALSYPYCMSAASDPDGDGWGWEYNRSCIVNRAPATSSTTFPTCASAASDPDGDGWGWENNRSCIVNRSGGTSGSALCNVDNNEGLILTAEAKARCADRVCANTQALLDFQKNAANGTVHFPGGVTLNSPALRSRLVAKFRDQVSCESQPSNGGTTNCPVEEHTLTFQRSEKGGCDTNYYFVARKPDGGALQYPAQLKNKLLWADSVNPYIGFQSVGEVVSIDPTYGLNEKGSTTTGACYGACVKIGVDDVSGDCCSCGGNNRTFKRAPWNAATYLCQ